MDRLSDRFPTRPGIGTFSVLRRCKGYFHGKVPVPHGTMAELTGRYTPCGVPSHVPSRRASSKVSGFPWHDSAQSGTVQALGSNSEAVCRLPPRTRHTLTMEIDAAFCQQFPLITLNPLHLTSTARSVDGLSPHSSPTCVESGAKRTRYRCEHRLLL